MGSIPTHRTMNDNRPFRIQGGNSHGKWRRAEPSTIPWWLAEVAYKEYAKRYGTQQSLERLNERGGFGRQELLDLLALKE